MKCPKCGGRLKREDSSYAWVYICEPCGLVILDFKLKLPGGGGGARESDMRSRRQR